jgi:hypothetical protein
MKQEQNIRRRRRWSRSGIAGAGGDEEGAGSQ